GCYVVARHDGEHIFRQLRIGEESWRLQALKPGHPVLEIKGLQDIRGRVIQRAGTRRKDRKSYI
ncbi:MAG: S24 family peptidase, partial [Pseudomonadota bacterium]|nr:S24 family peptidase [Pseudomonadota bacterium]